MSTGVPCIKAWRRRGAVLALLAGAALPASSAMGAAGPRAPLRWEPPDTPTVEMDVWLGRLVGRYRVDGMIAAPGAGGQEESITGTADCVGVGTGPGVQCIFSVTWNDIHEVVWPEGELSTDPNAPIPPPAGVYEVPGGVAYLNPAMLLLGVDPGQSAINHLLVNDKGLPEGGLGSVTGNRATFRTSCVNGPSVLDAMKPPPRPPQPPENVMAWRTCDRIIRINARPDASVVFIAVDIRINDDPRPFTHYEMTLRRESRTE